MDKFAIQALEEYNGDTKTVRRSGNNGKPFWNVNSSQFMYSPALMFPSIPYAKEYVYTARDGNGKEHTFTADNPMAPLTPIWKDIPTGFVELKVEGIHFETKKKYVAGMRTFYKCAPFPGREALPPRDYSYRECATKALRYAFNDKVTRYWLDYGKPDPNYYLNVYPAKMISAVVKGMIAYAKLEPENASDAMKLATNAADYLISITYGKDSRLAGLPPTYCFKDMNREDTAKNITIAAEREHVIMMIYPAFAGNMYLELEGATGDKKYLDAAKDIGDYYMSHVLENGSWYLMEHEEDTERTEFNCCVHFSIFEFLNKLYLRTGDEEIHTLERNYYTFLEKTCYEDYKWEGQFEDVALTGNYRNLTHISADSMICYIADNLKDDPEKVKAAEQLMRFVEDQFVVWSDFAPWTEHFREGETTWYAPAGLEQYLWNVPIDGSTAAIMNAFLNTYKMTGDELMLEKALALGDSITRVQDSETGMIVTHWMSNEWAHTLNHFWINCHLGTALNVYRLAEFMGEV